jgi:hypothetical protein
MARSGVRLDDATVARLAAEQRGQNRSSVTALWVGALALVALAILLALGPG